MDTSNRWFISDTHFGHNNILTFNDVDGNRLRPDWETADEMDEALVDNWNSVVKPNDTIYHLGDVCMPRRGLENLAKCNGRKILIRGNHDVYKLKDYTEYFEDVLGVKVYTTKQIGVKLVMSHIPIHMTSMDRWDANVHGHTHSNDVMLGEEKDQRYINVCVEKINFTPISMDEVLAKVMK